jgi:hypothetical protein
MASETRPEWVKHTFPAIGAVVLLGSLIAVGVIAGRTKAPNPIPTSVAIIAGAGLVVALILFGVGTGLWRAAGRRPRQVLETASLGTMIAYVALGIATLIAAITTYALAAKSLRNAQGFTPEIVLTILLVSGLIGLILILAVITAIFHSLNMTDPKASLGLPEGSVQAIIALSLILIFSIMALFLFDQLKSQQRIRLRGLTQAQVSALAPADLVAVIPQSNGTLDAIVIIPQNEASKNFAQQIGTTISTLVVAVAGFYFGSRAVSGAASALKRGIDDLGAGGPPSLRITSPSGTPLVPPEGLTIELEATPVAELIDATVDPESAGTVTAPLEAKDGNIFLFKQASGASGRATISFVFPNVTSSPVAKLPVVLNPEAAADKAAADKAAADKAAADKAAADKAAADKAAAEADANQPRLEEP